MNEIRLTLAQLYLGVLELLPTALENKPDASWKVLIDEAIKQFVWEVQNDEFFLKEPLRMTENTILETIKQYPQIKIIEFEGEE